MKLRKIYFAGKIRKDEDWRSELFDRYNLATEYLGQDIEYPKIKDDIIGEFMYSGPFFISCDHGCFHGEGSHGRGRGQKIWCSSRGTGHVYGKDVVDKCKTWINNSDFVFAWINSPDAYGSLIEIGYAKGLGKKVFVAMDTTALSIQELSDLWFSQRIADDFAVVDNIQEAWEAFVSWIK